MTTVSKKKEAKPEVGVSIEVVDVRFGTKLVQSPEITTVFEGKKVTFSLPMKQALEYSFKRVEDDMIFKMAVMIAGDLAGFLYLEVPHRFKSLKEFTLDDWFPVKQLDTDEADSKASTLFTARIKIRYAASRRLETGLPFLGKTPKGGVHDELALSLKERITELHAQIDAYADEGFRHLHNFETRLLERKAADREVERKKVPTPRVERKDLTLGHHKAEFYKGAGTPSKGPGVTRLTAEETRAELESTVGVEALLGELAFARKELVGVDQRLRGLREGRLTVDNVALKAKLEAQLAELSRDRREAALKLNDGGAAFEEERRRLAREAEKEKAELIQTIEDLREQTKELEDRAREAATRVEELQVAEAEAKNRRQGLDDAVAAILRDEEELKRQEEELQERFEEVEEIKQRMVAERQLLLEEADKLERDQAEVERTSRAAEARLRAVEDRRREFAAQAAEKRAALDRRRAELKGVRMEAEQRRAAATAERGAIDSQLKELAEEKRQMKAEAVRVWREKTKLQEEAKEFAEYKKVIEEEDAGTQAELEKDYKFLEEQLLQLEKGKVEMSGLKASLKQYEKFLDEEHRMQLEQTEKFNFAQKQFFDRLKQSQFDLPELRAFASKFNAELQALDQGLRAHEAAQIDLEKRKSKIRASIFAGVIETSANKIGARRVTVANARNSKLNNLDGLSHAAHILQIENKFQAQFEADKLLERIFNRACLHHSKTTGISNDRELEKLKNLVEDAEKRLKEEQQVSKELKLSLFVKNKAAILKGEAQSLPQAPSLPLEAGGFSNAQQDALDLFEVTTNQLKNQLGSAKDSKKIQERIAFVENSHKELESIFKNLNSLARAASEEQTFELEHLTLKSAYERKIKFLMDYIIKIRENYEFFNNEVDNQILAT